MTKYLLKKKLALDENMVLESFFRAYFLSNINISYFYIKPRQLFNRVLKSFIFITQYYLSEFIYLKPMLFVKNSQGNHPIFEQKINAFLGKTTFGTYKFLSK